MSEPAAIPGLSEPAACSGMGEPAVCKRALGDSPLASNFTPLFSKLFAQWLCISAVLSLLNMVLAHATRMVLCPGCVSLAFAVFTNIQFTNIASESRCEVK
jgi:hypothetical protein